MTDDRIIKGTPITMKDGSVLRIPTIPFSRLGFRLAEKLDELNSIVDTNFSIMKKMLDTCLFAVRLNYPKMTSEMLSELLDIDIANKILDALRGEVEE